MLTICAKWVLQNVTHCPTHVHSIAGHDDMPTYLDVVCIDVVGALNPIQGGKNNTSVLDWVRSKRKKWCGYGSGGGGFFLINGTPTSRTKARSLPSSVHTSHHTKHTNTHTYAHTRTYALKLHARTQTRTYAFTHRYTYAFTHRYTYAHTHSHHAHKHANTHSHTRTHARDCLAKHTWKNVLKAILLLIYYQLPAVRGILVLIFQLLRLSLQSLHDAKGGICPQRPQFWI